MKSRKVLWLIFVALLSSSIVVLDIHPSHAAPVFLVSLDSNSLSQTDISIQASATQVKTFRIGAVINATAANPLSNIYGWQFAINYNSTLVVPVADPGPASVYPDGAQKTESFGAQTSVGSFNWAGSIIAGSAFGASSVPSPGKIQVVFALFPPSPPVTLTANTLLANVAFEVLNTTITPQSFTVSNVKFVDFPSVQTIPGPTEGAAAAESITNDPPVAKFTSTQVPYVFSFDATSSSDGDGTIANPGGYFWDFGDGTQDLGVTG